ncbi:hypothetical protein S245_035520 [Arachis hypogaea]
MCVVVTWHGKFDKNSETQEVQMKNFVFVKQKKSERKKKRTGREGNSHKISIIKAFSENNLEETDHSEKRMLVFLEARGSHGCSSCSQNYSHGCSSSSVDLSN